MTNVVNATEQGVFASAADEMTAAGLAVLPLRRDRTPHVAGFNKWRCKPSRSAVGKWAADYPGANVGILPGLSGLTVVDCDDLAQDDDVEELCGATLLTVRTNRGRHRYYRRADVPLPRNLRAFGLNADILQGNGIVIAPPSIHRCGTRYTLEGADWSALRDLPPLNTERVRQLIGKQVKPPCGNAQWINDRLCAEVSGCANFDELLAQATAYNEVVGLTPSEVIHVAKVVWDDYAAGHIERWTNTDKDLDAFEAFCRNSTSRSHKRAADGSMLLRTLRRAHAHRVEFGITPKLMANAQVIAGWTRERYENARDWLLDAGLIIQLSPYYRDAIGRNHRARYGFGPRRLPDLPRPPWEAEGISRATYYRRQASK